MNKIIYSTTTQTGDDDDGIVTIPPSARHRAELAALEREIGRAVIGLHLIDQMRDHYDNDLWDNTVSVSTYKADAILANIFNSKEGPRLITRWRELHAEDAPE